MLLTKARAPRHASLFGPSVKQQQGPNNAVVRQIAMFSRPEGPKARARVRALRAACFAKVQHVWHVWARGADAMHGPHRVLQFAILRSVLVVLDSIMHELVA